MNKAFRIALLGATVLAGTVLGGCAAVGVGAAAGAGASVAVDRRTPGTVIDDQIIEVNALRSLAADAELWQQAHLNVTSYNGVVLLSGEAPSEAMRTRSADVVSRISKVRHVHNEVVVAAPSTLLSRSSDAYVTTKVKAALVAEKAIAAHRVKVVTENGTVFLMGLASPQEADTATEVARRVGGVQRVVRLFEYNS